MNKDWLFTGEGYVCGLRAAGVLIRNNMILVQKDKDGNEYALPGGHIKVGETLIEELQKATIYPAFLKEEIYRLNEPTKHFVSRE